MDHLHLLPREADAFDLEAGERLGDGDHGGRAPCERTLDEPERAGAERIVVVLRRHQPPRAKCAVDVRVHEMRVHDVGVAHGSPHTRGQHGVDVTRRGQALVGDGQRVVEGVGRARRIVEAQEADVDAPLRECGEQGQQVALGAADPADAVDVPDLHARRRRRPNTRSNTAAASNASRKSVEMR